MYSNVGWKIVSCFILIISLNFELGLSSLPEFSDETRAENVRNKRSPEDPKQCEVSMGLQTGDLADDQITASTYHSVTLAPQNCRLHGQTSWSALTLDKNQYLEFNFKDSRVITGISTQGRGDAAQWVQTYKIAYRTNTSDWIILTNPSGAHQIFTGNSDASTIVTHSFPNPVTCVKLRIMPNTWYGWMSLRMEIHGCFKPYTAIACDNAMGLRNGNLHNDQITASTYHSISLSPHNGRLFGKSSWSALELKANQYLEINFKGEYTISGVATQGRHDASQWVTTYTVSCDIGNSNWFTIKDESGNLQVFNGNYDSHTVITNYFAAPVKCKKLRINPQTWTAWMSMRAEILGCYKPYNYIACDNAMGLQNGDLHNDQITASTYHSTTLSPHNGRLFGKSSWSALDLNANQYLEINFKGEYTLSGVATQGRHDASQWVTTYTVSCDTGNSKWFTIKDESGKLQVFNGNYDSHTVITNYFAATVQCKKLRINPQIWTGWLSMRAEILGCYKPYNWTCDYPMGVESGKLLDDQITASTYHSTSLSVHYSRLHSASSWSALNLDQNQYIEFYFKGDRVISGISTQGRKGIGQWVNSYTVQYKTDKDWVTLSNAKGNPEVFPANYDSDTVITKYFDSKITCSRLQILPKKWTNWISMRVEIIGCFQPYGMQCDGPMGVESGKVGNDQITAFTYHSITLNPHNGRLNSPTSWSSLVAAADHYLELYFKRPHKISGISTQGRGDASQWVTSYIVTYRTNNDNWVTIKDVSGKDKMFVGNFDSNTIITNYFDEVISCSRLRIIPKRWSGWTSMRVEIRGCFTSYDVQCNVPMGMADGRIKDRQITASTYHSVSLNPHSGRLNHSSSWSALVSQKGPYYEVYFKWPRIISGISTQGRGDASQWVTSYKIEYRTNDAQWKAVKDISGQDQIFRGNFDSSTIITNYFDDVIICSRLRLTPFTWTNWMSMRVEIQGCFQPYETQCEEQVGFPQSNPTAVDVSASAFYSSGLSPQHSYLNSPSSWSAKDLNINQWLETNFKKPLYITAISTQGRHGVAQWVTAFKISYLAKESSWVFIVDEFKQPKVFTGNYDSSTEITHFFDTPITTSKVRIHPTQWTNWISMRAGFLGCDGNQVLTSPRPPTTPDTITTTTTQAATTTTTTTATPTTTTAATNVTTLPVNSTGCQLITLEPQHTLGIFYIIAENHWCINRGPISDLMACSGKCNQLCSLTNPEKCNCAPLKAQPRSISLHCTNGQVVPFVYLQPKECSCSACTNHLVLDERIE